MSRLTTIRPLATPLPPRIGYAPGDEQGRDKQRRDGQAWRAWYKTARWARLRQQVLVRDLFTCQRTGQLCTGKGQAPDAPVVNHKRPHRGDPALFWSIENLEVVAKSVHDSVIQSEERRAERNGVV